MNARYVALLLLGIALPAAADIYKYVDEFGVTTYTNLPGRLPSSGTTRVAVDPPPPVTMAAPPNPAANTPSTQSKVKPSTSAANFPRVDSDTQKKRDDSRRQILETELQAEEKLLSDSKQALTDGEAVRLGDERNYQKYLDRIQGLQDQVTLHDNNVAALKKELASLH